MLRDVTHAAMRLCALCVLGLRPEAAFAQTAASTPAQSAAAAAPIRWSVTNTSRIESWRFFDPPPTGGDPDYTFFANRLRVGVSGAWSRLDVNAAVQYVQFGRLPALALGPGPLGTGALYYDASGRTDSRGVYLRTLAARVRLPGGLAIQAGRFPYQSGGESPSGRPRIEAVKRMRLDGRLIGEFEWSLYQRSFDGIRGDFDRKDWHLTGAWFSPTQGGFEEDAGAPMPGVDVAAVTVGLRPSVAVPATDVNVFALRYADDRAVTARPDNTGLPADRVAVRLTTLGAAAVGSAPWRGGETDWLVWFSGQTGSWYGQPHRAWSLALEGGHQWKMRWQPWARGGFLYASGDGNPGDNRHGTFFPMLPTVRKYAFTASYAPMNLQDAFAEVIARPSARLVLRADVRRLRLANAADRWYAGSGASQQRGRSFGYAGRSSGGATDLGTAFEGAGDVTLSPHWSVNAFFGAIRGGRASRGAFIGEWLRFGYLENVIQF